MPESSAPKRVMRSYTPALKIPKFIGRLKDGTRLPGGPYTMTQFLVGVAVLVVGYILMPLWAQLLPTSSSGAAGWLIAHVVLVGVAAGSAYVTGYIPADANPVHAAGGLVSGGRPARFGIQAGRAVEPLAKPRHYQARVLIDGEEVPSAPNGPRPSVVNELSRVAAAARPRTPTAQAPRADPIPAQATATHEPANPLRALSAAIVKE